ncbi:hypothetical protein VZT92_014069 [Zoarces viviparus]|uniref:Uncharacterized protein n=1 Tax=Zoarces viviparus TaxID=48416 RepID=A0AAW1EZ20_ZOAVI
MFQKKHVDLNEEFISFKKKADESQSVLQERPNAEELKCEKREAKKQSGVLGKITRGLKPIANLTLQIQKKLYFKRIQFLDEEMAVLRYLNDHLENKLKIAINQTEGVQAERNKIKQKLLKVQQELTASKTTAEHLQDEVRLLKREADEENRALDKADQDNRSVKDQLEKVESQLLKKNFKFQTVKHSMADLSNKLDAAMAEKEKLEKELQHCNETVAQQQKQLQDVKSLTSEEMMMHSTKDDAHMLEKQQLNDFQKQLSTKMSGGEQTPPRLSSLPPLDTSRRRKRQARM